jgi:hypothetical protein
MKRRAHLPCGFSHRSSRRCAILAEAEGVALNQLINVAVAEKVLALRTESYIAERAARADIPKALRILKRAGVGRRPAKGDELPRSSRKQR